MRRFMEMMMAHKKAWARRPMSLSRVTAKEVLLKTAARMDSVTTQRE